MKGRVSCEDIDYKCSGPREQVSEKPGARLECLKGKQRGPRG